MMSLEDGLLFFVSINSGVLTVFAVDSYSMISKLDGLDNAE